MPRVDILRSSPVVRSPRVVQLEGLFDIPPAERSEERWTVELPIEDRDWNIGLIVGPSGSGKSTLARELFGEHDDHEWPEDGAVIDGFPEDMPIKEVVGLLSSVGFSSPPSWLRPFRVLSTGEQFRASVARTLAEAHELAVVDEFTSVVDRTVARIGSAAVAKAVRKRGQKLVAVSCHYDIEEWLQPDWVYDTGAGSFSWRELQRRPPVAIEIICVQRTAWRMFRRHHYLSSELNPSARCFCGLVEGQPAVFTAVISFPHPKRPGWREHRTVCLPDFQGIGIGNAMSEFVASVYAATGKPYRSTTGNPAMIYHRARSSKWRMTRRPGLVSQAGQSATAQSLRRSIARTRYTASFEYVGEKAAPDVVRQLLGRASLSRAT